MSLINFLPADENGKPKSSAVILFAIALVTFLLGVEARFYYIFQMHPPTDYLITDAKVYMNFAFEFFSDDYQPHIFHTIYPPGTPYLFGILFNWDPSFKLAFLALFLFSVSIPVLITIIGYELFGFYTAFLSLTLASVYFPFIDYAGYFLSEIPFTFTMLLSYWLVIRALKSPKILPVIVYTLMAGLGLGATASFRSVILLPVLLLVLVFGAVSIKYKRKHTIAVMVSGLIGLFIMLSPMAVRCTNLNEGRFCMISTNGALNFTEGQLRNVGVYAFDDKKRGLKAIFVNPASSEHGYNDKMVFPFGPYDKDKLLPYAFKWIRQHPLDALMLNIEDIFDVMIGTTPWPSSDSSLRPVVIFFQQLYIVFILLPILFLLRDHGKAMLKLDRKVFNELILILPTLGLIIAVFLTNGEPRYRIPFDAFHIILASRFYMKSNIHEADLFQQTIREDMT